MRTNCDGSAGCEVVFGYFQALWALGLLAGQKDRLVAWGRGVYRFEYVLVDALVP